MANYNLTNQAIEDSFQPLLQIDSGSALRDGTGSLVDNIIVTSSYAITASHALNVGNPEWNNIQNKPSGLVSGSSQISFNGITDVPSGLVSGSSQVVLEDTTFTDNGEFSFLQTDGAGNLSFQYVESINDVVYAGENITKTDPLYVSGSQGANPIVYKADAADPNKAAIYIAAENITQGSTGRGILLGGIDAVDLTGIPAGTTVYLGEGGGWSITRPSGSNSLVQPLGIVTKTGPGGKGEILNPGPATLPNLQSGYAWVGDGGNQPQQVATSSFSVSIDTGSLVTTSSFNAYTQSTDARLTQIELETASLDTRVTNLETFSSSLDTNFVSETEFGIYTSSNDSKVQSLINATGSLLLTASFDNNTRDLTFTKVDSSTFALNIPGQSGSVEWDDVLNKPSGLVSGSSQLTGSFVTTNTLQTITAEKRFDEDIHIRTDNKIRFGSFDSEHYINSTGANVNVIGDTINSKINLITGIPIVTTAFIPEINIKSRNKITGRINLETINFNISASNTIITGSVDIKETFTSSLQEGYILVGNSSNRTSAIPTSSLVVNIDTGSLVSTSSFNEYTSSTDFRLSSIELETASLDTRVTSLENFSSSLDTTFATDAELNNATQSLINSIATKLDTGSFNSYTQSTDLRITDLENFSSSLDATFATDAELASATQSLINSIATKLDSSSFNSFTQSYISDSSSFDGRIDSLEQFSSSLDTNFVSETEFGIYTSSNDNKVNSLINQTGSYATTGSNNFFGNQYISGELTSSIAKSNIIVNPQVITDNIIVGPDNNAFIVGPTTISGSVTLEGDSELYIFTPPPLDEYAITGSNNFKGDQNVSGSVVSTLNISNTHLNNKLITDNVTIPTGKNGIIIGDTTVTGNYIVEGNSDVFVISQVEPSTGGGVTSITAGSGIAINQPTGNVTISATGGGSIDTGSFATTGSNSFIGNQTITGSLTLRDDNPTSYSGLNFYTGSIPYINMRYNTGSEFQPAFWGINHLFSGDILTIGNSNGWIECNTTFNLNSNSFIRADISTRNINQESGYTADFYNVQSKNIELNEGVFDITPTGSLTTNNLVIGDSGNVKNILFNLPDDRIGLFYGQPFVSVQSQLYIDKNTGDWNITGSVNMKDTLNLASQDPLPTGSVGDLATSGSALYFHDGTNWRTINLT